jgi:hypothetical protein
VFLHDFRRLGLQDRIGVIADQLVEVAPAVGQARLVHHRTGTRWRRLEARQGWVAPYAGEIRDGCGALCTARGRNCRRPHCLPPGGRRCCCRGQYDRYNAIPLPAHAQLPFAVSFGRAAGIVGPTARKSWRLLVTRTGRRACIASPGLGDEFAEVSLPQACSSFRNRACRQSAT